MARYSSVTVSGYNSVPPADDGTVSEANKVKWSTQKTKLTDPLNTAIAAINTNLVSAFDIGPTALTLSTTLGATHYGDFVQTSGASLTHTLTDAATLGAGWHTYLVSTDANDVTIGRATGADTINGTAANITLYGNTVARIFVNAAGNGFIIDHGRISNNTFTPIQFFTAGIGPNYLQNISILPSAASKALTVALKTKAGTDPTATDFIHQAYRHTTLTNGTYEIRTLAAAASIVVPSGATLGFTASQTGYIYVYGHVSATGAIVPVVSGSNNWDEGALHSTTTISATADSGSVLYATTARTDAPLRYIGRIKIQTGAIAGEWDNQHTEVHVSGVSDKDTDEMTAAQRVQSFTASGTWTKPSAAATTDRVLIQAWGGGGGGGGGSSGGAAGGGGGGGGAYAERIVTISELAATVNLTIPAASAGGTQGNNGTVGGNVTFGSSLTAFGGGAGAFGAASVGGAGGGGGGEIAAGATSAAGTWSGGAGGAAEVAGVRSTQIWGGGGGGGGLSSTSSAVGGAAYKGGGGGGGGGNNVSGGASAHSGNGGNGVASGAGTAGTAPSGGGGGGGSSVVFTGGAGAVGQVIVTIL